MGHHLCSGDNRHDFRPYVSFTWFEFYIAVRCGFDKHLYLTRLELCFVICGTSFYFTPISRYVGSYKIQEYFGNHTCLFMIWGIGPVCVSGSRFT